MEMYGASEVHLLVHAYSVFSCVTFSLYSFILLV